MHCLLTFRIPHSAFSLAAWFSSRSPGRALAPARAAAFNPAFDVTPAPLVTAFVTDRGILHPPLAS